MPAANSSYIAVRTALVADTNEIYRSAIARLLQKNCGFQEVVEVPSVEAAIERLKADDQVAFLVVDVGGGPDPVDTSMIGGIRRTFADLVVVAMSVSDERADILAAIEAGVHGFIPKGLPLTRIAAALETVAAGEIYVPRAVADLFPKAARSEAKVPAKTLAKLTARQVDVLRLIRAGRSNRQIASELGLTEGTVKAHANAIFRALGVTNRSSAAAMEVG